MFSKEAFIKDPKVQAVLAAWLGVEITADDFASDSIPTARKGKFSAEYLAKNKSNHAIKPLLEAQFDSRFELFRKICSFCHNDMDWLAELVRDVDETALGFVGTSSTSSSETRKEQGSTKAIFSSTRRKRPAVSERGSTTRSVRGSQVFKSFSKSFSNLQSNDMELVEMLFLLERLEQQLKENKLNSDDLKNAALSVATDPIQRRLTTVQEASEVTSAGIGTVKSKIEGKEKANTYRFIPAFLNQIYKRVILRDEYKGLKLLSSKLAELKDEQEQLQKKATKINEISTKFPTEPALRKRVEEISNQIKLEKLGSSVGLASTEIDVLEYQACLELGKSYTSVHNFLQKCAPNTEMISDALLRHVVDTDSMYTEVRAKVKASISTSISKPAKPSFNFFAMLKSFVPKLFRGSAPINRRGLEETFSDDESRTSEAAKKSPELIKRMGLAEKARVELDDPMSGVSGRINKAILRKAGFTTQSGSSSPGWEEEFSIDINAIVDDKYKEEQQLRSKSREASSASKRKEAELKEQIKFAKKVIAYFGTNACSSIKEFEKSVTQSKSEFQTAYRKYVKEFASNMTIESFAAKVINDLKADRQEQYNKQEKNTKATQPTNKEFAYAKQSDKEAEITSKLDALIEGAEKLADSETKSSFTSKIVAIKQYVNTYDKKLADEEASFKEDWDLRDKIAFDENNSDKKDKLDKEKAEFNEVQKVKRRDSQKQFNAELTAQLGDLTTLITPETPLVIQLLVVQLKHISEISVPINLESTGMAFKTEKDKTASLDADKAKYDNDFGVIGSDRAKEILVSVLKESPALTSSGSLTGTASSRSKAGFPPPKVPPRTAPTSTHSSESDTKEEEDSSKLSPKKC